MLRKMEFANDCAKCYIFAQKCSTNKAKICDFYRKNTLRWIDHFVSNGKFKNKLPNFVKTKMRYSRFHRSKKNIIGCIVYTVQCTL